MSKYRGERWQLSYGVETAYGEIPTSSMSATNLFGVFDNANLPDPTFDHQSWWMMNPSNRNYYVAYKGKATSTGSIGNITLLDGRPLFLPIADAITHTGITAPYTHTINETVNLKPIRLVATNFGDEDISPDELTRWFVGGKVDSASYHCEEGGMLMMSLDNIKFKMPYIKPHDTITPADWYDTDAAKQTLTYPCTEPYYFSMGTIKLKAPILGMSEVTIPSVRGFRLNVTNSLTPKYYIADNVEKVPYQIYEGRREYNLSIQIDLIDSGSFTKDTILRELLNQGMDTTFKGAALELKFERGTNDSITFITPADYNPVCGGDSQGALVTSAPFNITNEGVVGVTMSMKCRNLKIVVVDAIAGTAYPV